MILTALLLSLFLLCDSAQAKLNLDPEISATLNSENSVDIIISFRDANVKDVRSQAVSKSRGLSRTDRIQSIYDALFAHAQKTQSKVLNSLQSRVASTMRMQSFWITNQLTVQSATKDLLDALQEFQEISAIRKQDIFEIDKPDEGNSGRDANDKIQWGVQYVEAPAVWEMGYRGQGVVVGHIDTGVHGEHEAIKDAIRPERGWFDAANISLIPIDIHGHGTHTSGIAVGRARGIGVAPGAQLMTCRAAPRGNIPEAGILACGQFMMCPTDPSGNNPRCDLAAHVVTNSYGKSENLPSLEEMLQGWFDAGITSVWSAGNKGSLCKSLTYPKGHPIPITVANLQDDGSVVPRSSRGPGNDGIIKPDVAAPGQEIYSGYPNASNGYVFKNGTSMAAPNVAGVVALMLSFRSNLSPTAVKKFLIAAAIPTVSVNMTCGDIPDTVYPNHLVGYGKINARLVIEKMKTSCAKKG